jgi:hypothetical protein
LEVILKAKRKAEGKRDRQTETETEIQLSMVAHACKPNTREAEVGG